MNIAGNQIFNIQENPFNLIKQFNNLSSFQTNINANFSSMAQVILKQINQINAMKDSIFALQKNQQFFLTQLRIQNNGTPLKEQIQTRINVSITDKSITCFGSSVKDPQVLQYKQQISKNAFQKITLGQNTESRKSVGTEVRNDDDNIDLSLSKDFVNNSSQGKIEVSYPSFGQIQTKQTILLKKDTRQQLYIQNRSDSNIKQLQLVEKKIFEMNQRLSALEIGQQKSFKINFKRFRELNMQIQKYEQSVHKNTGAVKMFQLEVQRLRSELTEYKLKKQSQLMKISNNLHQIKGQSSQNDFIIDKIVFLSKNVTEMVKKTHFESQIEEINKQIQNIKKNLKNFIQSEQLQASIQMLDRKIKMTSKNKPKKQTLQQNPQHQVNYQQQDQNLESKISQQLIEKLFFQEKIVKQLKNQIDQLALQLSLQRNKSNSQLNLTTQKTNQIAQNMEKLQFSMKNHQDFLKEMSKTYNGKLFDTEHQIIEIQQSMQKLSNQIKYYQHSRPDINMPNHQSGSQQQSEARNIEMQNQILQLKKKFGKFELKIQDLKEDLLKVRRDFATDVESIKAGVQKKADLDSLKQGLSLFEGHLKQLSGIVRDMNTTKAVQDKQQGSLATKKSWSCLCCDKEVKNLGLQGKLADVKFTSMFPSKFESPRIGGYYKQNQSERQYKAIYFQKQRKLIKSGSKEPRED